MSKIFNFKNNHLPLSLTKKIHKFSRFIRKPFLAKGRISSLNCSFAEDSISTCDLHSNEESDSLSMMEEEKSEASTPQYKMSTVSYTSPLNKRAYTFSCFSEKDMPIPEEYRAKIIDLSCDDDCMTDDEQIKGAIRKLHNSLQESITKRKQKEEEKNKA